MSQPSQQHLERLESAVATAWPPHVWRDSHVVLAVSGGADSAAMLQAVRKLKEGTRGSGKLYVAHLNHGLRGAAAAGDEMWLSKLCARLTIPLEVDRVDVASLAVAEGDGWEAAARRARYQFLRTFAERIGARYVAVAHTANDQAETVLHRILRGTGLSGLAGIPFSRALSESVTLVRPLLTVERTEVLRYLAALSQDYRADETNTDTRYTRNRLRHNLLPMLREQYNPEVDVALRRLAAHAAEAQALIGSLVEGLMERCMHTSAAAPRTIRINRRLLEGQSPLLVREVFRAAWTRAGWPLQAMRFHEWELLADLAQGPASAAALNLPGNVRVERRQDEVVMRCIDRDSLGVESC